MGGYLAYLQALGGKALAEFFFFKALDEDVFVLFILFFCSVNLIMFNVVLLHSSYFA